MWSGTGALHLLQHDVLRQVQHHSHELGSPRRQEERRQHFRSGSAALVLSGRGGTHDHTLHPRLFRLIINLIVLFVACFKYILYTFIYI